MKNANPLSGLVTRLALIATLFALAACGEAKKPVATTPKTVTDWFAVNVGATPVQMQFAVTMPEMEHGLMGRRELEPGKGMLFVYDTPQQMSFWMRNTPSALDIGFFSADGVLREVYPLYPFDERAVKTQRSDLQMALEVQQGWFVQAGIKPGDQLDLAAVRAALEARGFTLVKFGALAK